MKKILIILTIVTMYFLIIIVASTTAISQNSQYKIIRTQYTFRVSRYYSTGCYLCVNNQTKKYRYIKFRGNDTQNLRKKAEAIYNCKIIDVLNSCPFR